MHKRMQKTAYVICFFALAAVFVCIYSAGYWYATNQLDTEGISTRENTSKKNPVLENIQIKEAGVSEEVRVTSKTNYVLETYMIEDKTITKETDRIPLVLIGMDRQELVDYISENADKLLAEDAENLQLVSFTKDQVVLRQSKRVIEEEEYSYIIKVVNEKLVVYEADGVTVFINTSIKLKTLSQEEKDSVLEGKKIYDVHELYRYLESWSS